MKMKRKLSLFIIENCVVRRIKSQVRKQTCKRHNDALFLIICITIGLAGCNQTSPKNTEKTESESSETTLESEKENSENGDDMRIVNLTIRNRETINVEEMLEVKPALTISEHVIKLDENASIDEYIFAGEKLYYAIGYASYYYPFIQEGKELPDFKNEYNSQIRVYDIATGEDTVLYQYQKDYAVEIGNMRCNGECLIWTEAESEEYDWMMCEQTLNLTDGSMSYELFEEMLYDYVEKSENPITIDDVVTEYRHGNRWTKITIKAGDDVTELGVDGLVTAAMSDGRMCIWNVPVLEDNLHIYDLINDRYYSMGYGHVSWGNVSIYKHWLLMDLSDGLYVYNIPEGFYAKITDYNIGAMNTTDEGIYAGAYDNKNNEFTILHIE